MMEHRTKYVYPCTDLELLEEMKSGKVVSFPFAHTFKICNGKYYITNDAYLHQVRLAFANGVPLETDCEEDVEVAFVDFAVLLKQAVDTYQMAFVHSYLS